MMGARKRTASGHRKKAAEDPRWTFGQSVCYMIDRDPKILNSSTKAVYWNPKPKDEEDKKKSRRREAIAANRQARATENLYKHKGKPSDFARAEALLLSLVRDGTIDVLVPFEQVISYQGEILKDAVAWRSYKRDESYNLLIRNWRTQELGGTPTAPPCFVFDGLYKPAEVLREAMPYGFPSLGFLDASKEGEATEAEEYLKSLAPNRTKELPPPTTNTRASDEWILESEASKIYADETNTSQANGIKRIRSSIFARRVGWRPKNSEVREVLLGDVLILAWKWKHDQSHGNPPSQFKDTETKDETEEE